MSKIVFLSLFVSSLAMGQTDPVFTILKKGEAAPFEGYLMSKEAVIKMSVDKNYEISKRELEIKLEMDKELKQKQFEIDTLKIEVESLKKERDLVSDVKEKEIVKLNDIISKAPTDYSYAWFAGGTMVGVITSVAIFWAAVQTAQN